MMASQEPNSEVNVSEALEPSVAPAASYQESNRFLTWRKHTRNLYQQLLHIDLVWESPSAQFMPYATMKAGVLSQTLLTGTRTGGVEQSYLQMLSVTLPNSATTLEGGVVNDVTREVGGYGSAPSTCGLKIERRMLHDGDVMAARYMPANPLLVATSSSNGDSYIFDWSRVSLNKFPNDPPRPRAPLPPNELSEAPTDEEKIAYNKKMRALNASVLEQERWDARSGPGQHSLTLKGNCGISDCVDWSTSREGIVAAGSRGKVCVWQVADISKDASRVVEPLQEYDCVCEDEEARVTDVAFIPESNSFMISTSEGAVRFQDTQSSGSINIFTLPAAATAIAVSPLDPAQLLVGSEDGDVFTFDLRKSSEPLLASRLHQSEVTTLSWCPHSRHLFASGGIDGIACIYNVTRNTTLFKHAGHTERIMDLGWSWQEGCEGQLVCCDANAITVWRPRDYFFVA